MAGRKRPAFSAAGKAVLHKGITPDCRQLWAGCVIYFIIIRKNDFDVKTFVRSEKPMPKEVKTPCRKK